MKVLKNHFEERIEQLINIGTGDCASKDVVMSLRSIESVGQNPYKRYVTEVHENQPYPVWKSPSQRKSDLVTRIQLEIKYPDLPSTCDCKIFDGAAVVHALPVTTVSTFEKYADNIFIASIVKHLQ